MEHLLLFFLYLQTEIHNAMDFVRMYTYIIPFISNEWDNPREIHSLLTVGKVTRGNVIQQRPYSLLYYFNMNAAYYLLYCAAMTSGSCQPAKLMNTVTL